jgi:hypothetical protein
MWHKFGDSELSASGRSEERIQVIPKIETTKEVDPWSQPWSLTGRACVCGGIVSGATGTQGVTPTRKSK